MPSQDPFEEPWTAFPGGPWAQRKGQAEIVWWNDNGGRGAWGSESGCRSLDQRRGGDVGPARETRRWPGGGATERLGCLS